MPAGSCTRLRWQCFTLSVYDKLIEYDEMTVEERERRGLEQPLDAVVAILVGMLDLSTTGSCALMRLS
jgi:hypothetical protein